MKEISCDIVALQYSGRLNIVSLILARGSNFVQIRIWNIVQFWFWYQILKGIVNVFHLGSYHVICNSNFSWPRMKKLFVHLVFSKLTELFWKFWHMVNQLQILENSIVNSWSCCLPAKMSLASHKFFLEVPFLISQQI